MVPAGHTRACHSNHAVLYSPFACRCHDKVVKVNLKAVGYALLLLPVRQRLSIYLSHNFVVTSAGEWSVVQQG